MPAACQSEELAEDRDQQDQADESGQTELGRFRDREGKRGYEPIGQRPSHHDIVDHGLGGGGRNQFHDGGDGKPRERKSESYAVASQEPIELTI